MNIDFCGDSVTHGLIFGGFMGSYEKFLTFLSLKMNLSVILKKDATKDCIK